MNRIHKLGIGALALGVGVAGAVGIGQLAFAADPTPAPAASAPASDATTPGKAPDRGGKRFGNPAANGQARQADLAKALAPKLGVSEDSIVSALTKVREARTGLGRLTDAERADRHTALAKALASELKLDEAKVKAALDEVATQQQATRRAERRAEVSKVLDQAVADGKLTRAEADGALKAVDAGVLGGGKMGAEKMHRHGR